MQVRAFHELQAGRLTRESLMDEINSKGHVLIRDLIPQDVVRSVLADITKVLSDAGWLSSKTSPLDRIPAKGASYGDPDPIFKKVYQTVFNLESWHALPHQPSLRAAMQMLVGDQVLVHPKPIGRLIFPNSERLVVHPHQDYEFMGGDPEFYTVWIPLHDCPIDTGPLKLIEGSHRLGIKEHQRDDLHVPEIPMPNVDDDGWISGQINAGDVLIFHSLTVHAAMPNISDRMRISLDCRFQDARRVLNPSNLVFAGESGKSWEKTYAGWQSDSLRYYWKKLPLTLKPTREELEHLAKTADSPSKCARYSRMVSQLS
jgi:ectoine hydroxylase-related dioxygenase (phytanoyl-CoA dioxygenase family)